MGAAADSHRLPRLDVALKEGDTVSLGESVAQVFDVPGHTVGHIAYYFAGDGALFSADSLMVMGCGRLFEGTPDQMWRSLSTMAALPDDTLVYSGHEYAESNVRFALSVDGENPALRERAAEHLGYAADGRRDSAGSAGPGTGDQPVPSLLGRRVQGTPGNGENVGCPSFRRDTPTQGRFLSKTGAGDTGLHDTPAIFLRFDERVGIITLEARRIKPKFNR